MADSNDEDLPPSLLLPQPKRGRGRPRKERKPQPLCRSAGRFVRCPELGPRPSTLRKHRARCRIGEPLQCPRGATLIKDPPGPKGVHGMRGTRKEACLFVPPQGSGQPARFVRAICRGRGETSPPPAPGLFSPRALPAPAAAIVRARPTQPPTQPPPAQTPPGRTRGPKIYDWSKCRCGPGLKTFKLSSGALRCQGPKGFVRALCDESAYSRSEPTGQASAASRRKKAKKKAKRS